jgi:parvulin-like peptidyl-prolyl isomerase
MTNADRGFFGHGDMQKEFEEAAFKLEKGEVSEVVDTASGLHLIQRLETKHNAPYQADRVRNRLE